VGAERLKEQENNNLKRLSAELQAAGEREVSHDPSPRHLVHVRAHLGQRTPGLPPPCDAFLLHGGTVDRAGAATLAI